MKTFTATFNGITIKRNSEHDYTTGVVAVFPEGNVKLISCHRDAAEAKKVSLKVDGTASRYAASRDGATFHVVPLTASSGV